MKKICAYIKTHRVGEVIAALHELPCFPGFTVLDGHGQGHGCGAGGLTPSARTVCCITRNVCWWWSVRMTK